MGLALEKIAFRPQTRIETLVVVAFVGNFADDLLDDVLQRHQTQRRTVFVDHDSHVHLVRLEVAQQVIDLLMLRHEIGLADQLLPSELVAVVDVGQQILDIKRTPDVVDILLEDRNARKSRRDDRPLDFLVIVGQLDGCDVHAGLHDLLHLGVDEIHDPRQHHMLLRVARMGHVDGIGQIVERNFALVRGFLADAAARMHQDVGKRIEHPPQHRQRLSHELGELYRRSLRQHLRQHFAEEQQEERNNDRLEKELQVREREKGIDDAGHEYGNADVDQIIDDQNRGQQKINIAQQFQDSGGRSARPLLESLHVVVRKREKRSLGTRHERRNAQQKQRCDATYDDMGREPVEYDPGSVFQVRVRLVNRKATRRRASPPGSASRPNRCAAPPCGRPTSGR